MGANQQHEKKGTSTTTAIIDLRYAIIGGVVTALLSIVSAILVGNLSPYKALSLVQSLSPSIRFLSSAIMTACATILALMLTMLSLSANLDIDGEFRKGHYTRIRQIAAMCIIDLIVSVLLLLIVSIPLKEVEEISGSLYEVVYYINVVFSSLVGGLFITIILSLFSAIRGIVGVMHPGQNSLLVDDKEKEKEKREEKREREEEEAEEKEQNRQ